MNTKTIGKRIRDILFGVLSFFLALFLFLDAVCAGEFVYVWDPDSDFYEGVPRSSIYSTPNQAHLFLRLDDGTTVRLRLIEGGYVGFDGPAGVWYFVKIPGESFDAMYDSCGGSHETGWTINGK